VAVYSVDENLTPVVYCQQCILVLCLICWSWYWFWSRESLFGLGSAGLALGLGLGTAGLDYSTGDSKNVWPVGPQVHQTALSRVHSFTVPHCNWHRIISGEQQMHACH